MKMSLLTGPVLLALFASLSPARADEPAPPSPQQPAQPVVTVPTFENKTCPIMGKPSSKVLFTDTDFGRVYVCCMPCIAKIKLDPARAIAAAYPVTRKAGNVVDPVTGEKIGAKPFLLVLQGHEIALASEQSAARARANAQIVLTKALNPRVVDVGNGTDPITGKPVVDNVFVLVDDDLIHLSAATSVEQVRREPAKARTAAREIAAREAAARAKPANSPSPTPR